MHKILELFIKDPEREFHVRGISKLVDKSPTTVSKYLKKLARDNILLLENLIIFCLEQILKILNLKD